MRRRQPGDHARNVGTARAVGFQTLIGDEPNPTGLWLASTDADSQVEPTWLRQQLDLAREGADVVLGVVRLDHDSTAPELRQAFDVDYQKHLFRRREPQPRTRRQPRPESQCLPSSRRLSPDSQP